MMKYRDVDYGRKRIGGIQESGRGERERNEGIRGSGWGREEWMSAEKWMRGKEE